jgi:D-arabinose 1-dehydrogenase-like Zn-dependent alcohol dehydrogenase
LATHVTLPRRFLAPALPRNFDTAAAAALLGAAGPTYQAMSAAGMAPGDAVVVVGDPGPGALPLTLLVAAGLRPLWISAAPRGDAPSAVTVRPRVPDADTLDAARYHVLDLSPTTSSLRAWSHLAGGALSCTLVGPGPQPADAPLDRLLAGEATLRAARDLHPDLALDLIALGGTGRLSISDRLEPGSLSSTPERYARFLSGVTTRWPVLVVDSPGATANNA